MSGTPRVTPVNVGGPLKTHCPEDPGHQNHLPRLKHPTALEAHGGYVSRAQAQTGLHAPWTVWDGGALGPYL